MKTELLQPPSLGSFVCFTLISSRGGGSTAGAVTLDTVANESKKKMADGVARSPYRLCNRNGENCCFGVALSTIFFLACFCALLLRFRFSFLFFLFLFFPAPRYVYLLCVPSSVRQQSAISASTCFIVRILSACVICTLPHLGTILFFIRLVFFSYFLFLLLRFFLWCSRTRYART